MDKLKNQVNQMVDLELELENGKQEEIKAALKKSKEEMNGLEKSVVPEINDEQESLWSRPNADAMFEEILDKIKVNNSKYSCTYEKPFSLHGNTYKNVSITANVKSNPQEIDVRYFKSDDYIEDGNDIQDARNHLKFTQHHIVIQRTKMNGEYKYSKKDMMERRPEFKNYIFEDSCCDQWNEYIEIINKIWTL